MQSTPSHSVRASSAPLDPGITYPQAFERCRVGLLAAANKQLGRCPIVGPSAEDFVHDTYVEAEASWGSFRGRTIGELFSWLRTIMWRRISCVRRQLSKVSAAERLHVELMNDGRGSQLLADERVERQAAYRRILESLRRLPDWKRRIIQARLEGGATWDKIGAQCGRSADAVRKLWHRTIKSVRRALGRGDNECAADREPP